MRSGCRQTMRVRTAAIGRFFSDRKWTDIKTWTPCRVLWLDQGGGSRPLGVELLLRPVRSAHAATVFHSHQGW